METVKIDKNSWHYQFIDTMVDFRHDLTSMNTCQYVRRFFAALFKLLFVVVVTISFVATGILFFYSLGASFMVGWNIFNQIFGGMILVFLVGIIVTVSMFIVESCQKIKWRTSGQESLSPMIKENGNICRKVEFVDGKG